MKRAFSVVLSFAMAAALVGCGDKKSSAPPAKSESKTKTEAAAVSDPVAAPDETATPEFTLVTLELPNMT